MLKDFIYGLKQGLILILIIAIIIALVLAYYIIQVTFGLLWSLGFFAVCVIIAFGLINVFTNR